MTPTGLSVPLHDSNQNIRSHTVTRVEVIQSKSWCKITLICSQATFDLWRNDFDMKLNDFVVKKKHQVTTADTFSWRATFLKFLDSVLITAYSTYWSPYTEALGGLHGDIASTVESLFVFQFDDQRLNFSACDG